MAVSLNSGGRLERASFAVISCSGDAVCCSLVSGKAAKGISFSCL